MGYCADVGMRCFDVTPAMRKAAVSSNKPLYIGKNTHRNIHGNLVAAEAEARFLAQELCPSDVGNAVSEEH